MFYILSQILGWVAAFFRAGGGARQRPYDRQVASERGESWVDVIRCIDWQYPACSEQCGLSNRYGGGDYQKQEREAIMDAMFWVSMFVLFIAIVMSRDY